MDLVSTSALVTVSDLDARCRVIERRLILQKGLVVLSVVLLVTVTAALSVAYVHSLRGTGWQPGTELPFRPLVGPSGIFSGYDLLLMMAAAWIPAVFLSLSLWYGRKLKGRLASAQDVLAAALMYEARFAPDRGLIPYAALGLTQKQGDFRAALKEWRNRRLGVVVLFGMMLLLLPVSYIGFLPFEEPATWGVYIYFAVCVVASELDALIWQRHCERLERELALMTDRKPSPY